mmetsp:Transcript_60591/g.131336  ORF Transcript_60591/g.131336 Transcript_60591/m.131336 type:complete len:472 (+) Transcript_60591:61-1476(+)
MEDIPSAARLLAAGQRGEAIALDAVYGPCKVANVPGKGRGLLATGHVPAGNLLLLEPALAQGCSDVELATNLRELIEESETPAPDGKEGKSKGDGRLLRQLLSLAWGAEPTSVPEVAEAEAEDFMKRGPPSSDPSAFEEARRLLADSGKPGLDFSALLQQRLELAVRCNAFRSSLDALGALAWHSLWPAEQRALAESNPAKMPSPRLWMFLHAAMFNHSETPNATWCVAGGVIVVRAAAAIPAGTELTLSYWPDVDASDAVAHDLLTGYGMSQASISEAVELSLSEEAQSELLVLKKAPSEVAGLLADVSSYADTATAFDDAAAAIASRLSSAERVLPRAIQAFLEPRLLQAQLSLQQAAILSARGDPARGDQLRKLGLARAREALKLHPQPWGKRVLLSLIFTLKGAIRPAPAAMLSSVSGEAQNFSVQLAKQARFAVDDIRAELERAVEAAFGDAALLPAVLSKCGCPV